MSSKHHRKDVKAASPLPTRLPQIIGYWFCFNTRQFSIIQKTWFFNKLNLKLVYSCYSIIQGSLPQLGVIVHLLQKKHKSKSILVYCCYSTLQGSLLWSLAIVYLLQRKHKPNIFTTANLLSQNHCDPKSNKNLWIICQF